MEWLEDHVITAYISGTDPRVSWPQILGGISEDLKRKLFLDDYLYAKFNISWVTALCQIQIWGDFRKGN